MAKPASELESYLRMTKRQFSLQVRRLERTPVRLSTLPEFIHFFNQLQDFSKTRDAPELERVGAICAKLCYHLEQVADPHLFERFSFMMPKVLQYTEEALFKAFVSSSLDLLKDEIDLLLDGGSVIEHDIRRSQRERRRIQKKRAYLEEVEREEAEFDRHMESVINYDDQAELELEEPHTDSAMAKYQASLKRSHDRKKKRVRVLQPRGSSKRKVSERVLSDDRGFGDFLSRRSDIEQLKNSPHMDQGFDEDFEEGMNAAFDAMDREDSLAPKQKAKTKLDLQEPQFSSGERAVPTIDFDQLDPKPKATNLPQEDNPPPKAEGGMLIVTKKGMAPASPSNSGPTEEEKPTGSFSEQLPDGVQPDEENPETFVATDESEFEDFWNEEESFYQKHKRLFLWSLAAIAFGVVVYFYDLENRRLRKEMSNIQGQQVMEEMNERPTEGDPGISPPSQVKEKMSDSLVIPELEESPESEPVSSINPVKDESNQVSQSDESKRLFYIQDLIRAVRSKNANPSGVRARQVRREGQSVRLIWESTRPAQGTLIGGFAQKGSTDLSIWPSATRQIRDEEEAVDPSRGDGFKIRRLKNVRWPIPADLGKAGELDFYIFGFDLKGSLNYANRFTLEAATYPPARNDASESVKPIAKKFLEMGIDPQGRGVESTFNQVYWKNRHLMTEYQVALTNGHRGSGFDGFVMVLAKGPGTLVAHPEGSMVLLQGEPIIYPAKGKSIRIAPGETQSRPQYDRFKPVELESGVTELEVLVFDEKQNLVERRVSGVGYP